MTTRITTQNITDATITTTDLASSVPLNTQWQAVVTASTLNVAAGKGYFINTTSNTCTVTLPGSPSAGDFIVLKDYARNWGTNAVTMASNLFDGVGSQTPSFSTEGQTVTLIYMDGTKGWSLINDDNATGLGALFITATGGTVTTVDTNFKVHTFTGDGCFVVSSAGNASGSNKVSYVVVAGGGGSVSDRGGAGGAGGFREGSCSSDPYYPNRSPLATTALPVGASTFPITVGAGGAGDASPPLENGANGANSVFSTITSTGGGGGGRAPVSGQPGGSGGGGGCAAGSGNTPPVIPSQGNNGGTGTPNSPPVGNGGGGGATAAGANAPGPSVGGAGGAGATTSISGSATAFSGGGGGGTDSSGGPGSGGTGGGGNGANAYPVAATSGTTNTGGGAGGSSGGGAGGVAKNGGSGIVTIRYKFQ